MKITRWCCAIRVALCFLTIAIACSLFQAGVMAESGDWESVYREFMRSLTTVQYDEDGNVLGDHGDSDGEFFALLPPREWQMDPDNELSSSWWKQFLLADSNCDGTPELHIGDYIDGAVNCDVFTVKNKKLAHNSSEYSYFDEISLYSDNTNGTRFLLAYTDSSEDGIHSRFYTELTGYPLAGLRRVFEIDVDMRGKKYYYINEKRVSKTAYNKAYTAYFSKLTHITDYIADVIIENKTPFYNFKRDWMSVYERAVTDYKQKIRLGHIPGKSDYVPVSNLALDRDTVTVYTGDRAVLTPTIYPQNATVKNVKWTVGNPNIVSVSADGILTGKKVGKTIVKCASVADKTKYDKCVVVVKKGIPVKSVTLEPSSILMCKGQNAKLSANIKPILATNKTLLWDSEDKWVAIVNNEGEIFTIGEGETYITAQAMNGITARAKVSVCDLKLNMNRYQFENEDDLWLVASGYPQSEELLWKSNNTSVARVAQNGVVTPIEHGKAVITVCMKNNPAISATCEVSVGKYRAVLISGYGSNDDERQCFQRSRTAFEAMLKRQDYDGLKYTDVKFLNSPTPNEVSMLMNLVFKDNTRFDVSLFYYVGHAANRVVPVGSLLTSGSTADDAIYPTFLGSELDAYPGTKIVILDSCFSGAFIEDEASASKKMLNAFTKGVLNRDNYYVLVACKSSETTWSSGLFGGAFGYFNHFTRALCKAGGFDVEQWTNIDWAAVGNDNKVTLREACKYVKDQFLVSILQTPQYYGDGNFVLFQSP